MKFGELIRDQRSRKGLSQTQLAEIAGVSFSVISRMERGETVGRGDTIAKVANALNLDASLVQRYLSDASSSVKPLPTSPASMVSILRQALAIAEELERKGIGLSSPRDMDDVAGGRRLAHARVAALTH